MENVAYPTGQNPKKKEDEALAAGLNRQARKSAHPKENQQSKHQGEQPGDPRDSVPDAKSLHVGMYRIFAFSGKENRQSLPNKVLDFHFGGIEVIVTTA